MRLDRRLRRAIYATFAVLLVTGVGWIIADALKEPSGSGSWEEIWQGTSLEIWQQIAVSLLTLHGGAGMVMLLLLGALVPLHLGPAWRGRRNWITGSAMVILNAVLIVTAFGLYYLGSDAARTWFRLAHIGCGLALPALLLVHLWSGRRRVKMTGGAHEVKCLNRFQTTASAAISSKSANSVGSTTL
jgi:hypothetical protein